MIRKYLKFNILPLEGGGMIEVDPAIRKKIDLETTKTKLTLWGIFLLLLPLTVPAETAYIDDKVMVGLHQDKDIDSPIIKLLPGGTSLKIIKSDTPLTQVQEPAGASGWIDNQYLTTTAPGNARLLQLQEQVSTLETELTSLRATTTGAEAPAGTIAGKLAALEKENAELQQKLQSERLRAGEMEAKAAELRNQLSNVGVPAADQVEQDAEAEAGAGAIRFALGPFNLNARSILIGMLACAIIGLIGGIALMDWYNRRRHGGFRV